MVIKKIRNYNKGFTYVELIIVLSIYSIMSAIIIFDYQGFQAQIDIRNLASDIALQVVQAQKASLSGTLPPLAQQALITSSWKPAYGVYFNIGSGGNNKSFVYFTDLNQNSLYDNVNCVGTGECLNNITITKGNTISRLDVFYQGDPTAYSLNDLTLTFTRPNGGAILNSTGVIVNSIPVTPGLTVNYVQITILSPKTYTSTIKVYPSGRIQIN